jgi:hypothetical protein
MIGDHRELATAALNRYLALGEVRIERGHLVRGASQSGVFEVMPKWRGDADPRNWIDDPHHFRIQGGLGRLDLGHTVNVLLSDAKDAPSLAVDHVYLVPPWLRPSSARQWHPLTKAYSRLLHKLAWYASKPKDIDAAVTECVRLALDESTGAGGFLRREVLGRRLTRSARAVIVPRPDLRIDQIAIPEWVAERLFSGLPVKNRSLVLVNRNPTLHRQGLVALRPVIERTSASHVFGIPLGVLRAFGADFDGDQATIIGLETVGALAEAERLLPGAGEMRVNRFKQRRPAFPLSGELADAIAEEALASNTVLTQEPWCEAHHRIQRASVANAADGWNHPLFEAGLLANLELWNGLDEEKWRSNAKEEMKTVLAGVRRKSQLGGVMRRELYRRRHLQDTSLWKAIDALQSVTERMTQTALSVKSGAGATAFKARDYFADPVGNGDLLATLDNFNTADIADALGKPEHPRGLLGWLARPSPVTLMREAQQANSASGAVTDPRVSWFLG